jgi:lysyl endopeptidase
MKTNFKLLISACTLALLTACGNNTSTDGASAPVTLKGSPLGSAPTVLAQAVDAYTPPASAQQHASPMKARDLSAAPIAANVALGAPVASMAAAAKATSSAGKPFQIGFGRDVAQTATAEATQHVLKWQTTAAGGQVAAINFNSTGAKGLRIGLLVTQLPASATLRFYAKGATTAFEVNGDEVLAVLAKNLAAGDKTDAGRTFWGPVIEGTDATVEIELPAGVAASAVDVAIPSVTHMFMSVKEGVTASQLTGYSYANDSLSCQVDVVCSATLPVAAKSVAELIFNHVVPATGLMGTYICTGTLLNNTANNGIPYVLTANHCIANQTVASSLTSWWQYRSSSCNATNGNYYATIGGGAVLLYTAYGTDTTLLRLNGTPPAGVLFAGWDASTVPTVSTAVSDIHHPSGDAQRLSRGTVNGYYTRDTVNALFFKPSDAVNSTILSVKLTTGIVEPGSSGSGLFKGADSNPQLIGQLYGGEDAVCSTTTTSAPQATVYGRFDVAFKAGMSAWLSPAAVATNPNRQPVYRFYNAQSNVYFYTISSAERDTILATLTNALTYEGIAFYASPTSAVGYSTIYRFRNTVNGSYLYTISEVEKNSILQGYPQYVLEGTAWFAEPSTAGGGSPLYRFRTNNNTHIYTAYESERASILANYPSFVFEGPAYYVKLTP